MITPQQIDQISDPNRFILDGVQIFLLFFRFLYHMIRQCFCVTGYGRDRCPKIMCDIGKHQIPLAVKLSLLLFALLLDLMKLRHHNPRERYRTQNIRKQHTHH